MTKDQFKKFGGIWQHSFCQVRSILSFSYDTHINSKYDTFRIYRNDVMDIPYYKSRSFRILCKI